MKRKDLRERDKQLQQKQNVVEQEVPIQMVGTLEITHKGGFVATEHKLIQHDIFIPKYKLGDAQTGDKVVVNITQWVRKRNRGSRYSFIEIPEGEIVEILGQSGENNAEMHAILAEYGLPYSYPQELEEIANRIPDEIPANELRKRIDMREVTTFTIDPKDAKDFDDALSIQVKSQDSGFKIYEIGVHIADVTYYIQPNTALDREAYKRATSVYLVDRTIPMIPEKLSNELCSLRPNEDKLCFSVIFTIDNHANVLSYKIAHTIIRSNRRFTYEEAQQRIETGESDYVNEINELNRLAQILRQHRFDRGAIGFDREEMRFEIDENGKPLSVYFKKSEAANQLIEEFMLLANRTVATHIAKECKNKPFVYRIHDLPDPNKLQDLSKFIRRFGYNLKTSNRKETTQKNIHKMLGEIKGSAEENMIATLTVRAMAKAIYSTDNIGHYGLAFPYYTHFTSPIRRYPDMMVHRLLDHYLAGGTAANADEYEKRCEHCSAREQLAANAERASIKYKQVEFMSDKVGQVFDGVISGVTEWGIYVELNENKCEGMIPIRTLSHTEYFIFNEKEYCVEGSHTGTRYQLGDAIRVIVTRADLLKKQLDFALAR